MSRPALATTQRSPFIVTCLFIISDIEALADFNSERHQASCWLVNDDLKEHKNNDYKLM